MNFDLVEMAPAAMKQMNSLLQVDPAQWQASFKDWSQMSLSDDLALGRDYQAISLANWNKLSLIYGGAPEIPIFLHTKVDAQGTKTSHHDFHPIKIRLRFLESITQSTKDTTTQCCLASRHMSATQFIAYLCGLYPDFTLKTTLFAI